MWVASFPVLLLVLGLRHEPYSGDPCMYKGRRLFGSLLCEGISFFVTWDPAICRGPESADRPACCRELLNGFQGFPGVFRIAWAACRQSREGGLVVGTDEQGGVIEGGWR